MTISRRAIHAVATTGAVALLAVGIVSGAAAQSQEDKAVAARQGLMKLIVWEAGPLFGMAKGDMAYDAEMATMHAENLAALGQYSANALFMPGTSIDEMPDGTSALPAIWQDQEKFHQGFHDFEAKTAALAAEAGKGEDALRAAMGDLGKSCGNCHESFRQKK